MPFSALPEVRGQPDPRLQVAPDSREGHRAPEQNKSAGLPLQSDKSPKAQDDQRMRLKKQQLKRQQIPKGRRGGERLHEFPE